MRTEEKVSTKITSSTTQITDVKWYMHKNVYNINRETPKHFPQVIEREEKMKNLHWPVIQIWAIVLQINWEAY